MVTLLAATLLASGAVGRPPAAGRGGRGGRGRKRFGAGGGRSSLLALLQAVEEQELYSSRGGAAAQRSWGSDWGGMDWTAADQDVDMEDDEDVGRGGRPRRAAAKRPRYFEDSSSVEVRSEAFSADSGGVRRYAAASDYSDGGEESDDPRRRKGSRPGGAFGRYPSQRALDDSQHAGSTFGGRAGAAAAAAAAAGAHRVKGVRQPSPALQQSKKHRWVAGANQWLTEDGLTVWPKVCQRVLRGPWVVLLCSRQS